MQKRSNQLMTVLLLASLLTLSSLSFALAQDPAQVSFHVIWGANSFEYNAFERLVDRFNAENDHIEVELLGGDPSVYFDRLMILAATDDAPDVFVMGIDAPQPLVDGGHLLDISTTRLADSLPWDEYIPVMQENVLYGDHWYTIPWFIDNTWMLYSPSLFGERGLDPNHPPQDWDELKSFGTRFVDTVTEDPAARTYGFKTDAVGGLGGPEGWWFMPYAFQAGATFYDEEQDRVTLDHPGVIEAVQFLNEGVNETGYIVPPNIDTAALITQGNLAMWHALPAHTWVWEQLSGEQPGTAMLPANREHATQMGGWQLYLSHSANRDEVMEFVEWLTQRDNQAQFAIDTHTIPPRYDILTGSDLFRDYMEDNPHFIPLMEQAPFSRLVHPNLRRAPIDGINVESALQSVLFSVFTEGMAIPSAISEQQRLLDGAYQATRQER